MNLVLVTPRATEKAYRLITVQNTYVFDVPVFANKQQIADSSLRAQGETNGCSADRGRQA